MWVTTPDKVIVPVKKYTYYKLPIHIHEFLILEHDLRSLWVAKICSENIFSNLWFLNNSLTNNVRRSFYIAIVQR